MNLLLRVVTKTKDGVCQPSMATLQPRKGVNKDA